MKIFVGNLPWTANERDIRKLFEEYVDDLTIEIVKDDKTEIPKGYAYVYVDDRLAAEYSISKLNGVTHHTPL